MFAPRGLMRPRQQKLKPLMQLLALLVAEKRTDFDLASVRTQHQPAMSVAGLPAQPHPVRLEPGALLARVDSTTIFEQLLARFPAWELAGPAQRWASPFLQGMSSLPLRFQR